MRRRMVVAAAGLASALGAGPAGARRPAAAPSAACVAYEVADAGSGAVLAEKDAHRRWPPASMAKMMTVLIAMERVRSGASTLAEPVHTSAWAAHMGGSQVYLAEGEAFPLGEMLEAIMIASANDAAVAVAEHVAGSETAFVTLMNQRARELGMAETTYETPHGLPPGPGQRPDVTSAHDLVLLGRALTRFPEVMQWAATPSAGFRNGTLQMMNTNHLVRGGYPGATGLKTGYYAEAGFEVTATATRGDLSVIAAVLGCPTKQASFAEAARLMNEAFAGYRVLVAARRDAPVGEVPVSGGAAAGVKAVATEDLRLLLKRADDKAVQVEAHLPRLVAAPVRRRQALGEVIVRQGDRELGRVPVVADADVPATGWLSWIWNRGGQPGPQ
ncbi:MAG TPA: D-alanyl-D-alanine carboxypeptidase family protein [Candidatus Binatia bacterium]|nr:D-alanyl-D-alanine carboxypeptidase family protein [Candidatus Binatia bacterium]